MQLVTVIPLLLALTGVASRDWYVSRSRGSNDSAGSISDIQQELEDGDIIYISGPEPVYDCMPQLISISVILIGTDNAILSANCENVSRNSRLIQNENVFLNIAGNFSAYNETQTKVSFVNLTFAVGVILAVDVEVDFEGCVFDNATLRMAGYNETFNYDFEGARPDDPYYLQSLITHHQTCQYARVTFTNTTWYQTIIPYPSTMTETGQLEYDILIKCSVSDITVTDSFMGNRRLQIFAKSSLTLLVDNVIFEGHPSEESKVGGLSALLPLTEEATFISIQNSQFRHLKPVNIFYGRLFSKNIRSAPIVLVPHRGAKLNGENANIIQIINCSFIENQRAIALGEVSLPIEIKHCLFRENKVIIDGGAIYTSAKSLNISDSRFIRNQGGSFYHYRDLVGQLHFVYRHYKSHIYRYEVKEKWLIHYVYYEDNTTDVITYGYAGGGGAVYIDQGHVNVINCDFIDNCAIDSGGAIRVSNKGGALVKNSHFKNPQDINNTLEGYHVFSIGKMLALENVTFDNDLIPQNNIDSSALFVFGEREGCHIQTLTMKCPAGFNLFIFNTSSKSNSKHNTESKTNIFDTIYYSCDTCTDKYNLIGGSLNVSASFDNSFSLSNIIVDHDEGDCLPCPYGGNCSETIVAKPNYWGAFENHSIRFFACPKGYCCNNLECEHIDVCSFNRTGRLCGRCREGFTQALFSTHCITRDNCNDSWIIFLAALLGVAYTAFLMFQKDITNSLVSSPVSMRDIAELCCSCAATPTNKKPPVPTDSVSALASAASVSTILEDGVVSEVVTNGHTQEASPVNGAHIKQPEPVNPPESPTPPPPPATNNGGGLLVLLFYYFQDAALIKISTVYVTPNQMLDDLELIVSEVFRFRFNFFSLIASDVCIFPHMDIIFREFLVAVFAPLLILISIVLYSIFKLLFWCTGSQLWNSVALRAVSSLMLGLLFSFQKLATTSFSFLHCVPVLGTSVLFIDGTVTCYELWQWLTLVYVLTCILPFSVHLAIAPSLLERGWITFPEFVIASLFPLPFLISWPIRFRQNSKKPKRRRSKEAETICGIVQGPYRLFQLPGVLKSFCWSGNIMFRRLLLMIARTFLTNNLMALSMVFIVCTLSIIQHVHIRPYKDSRFNLAGTLSAAALLTVASINLLKAAFEVAEYIPQGPILDFMEKLDTAESVVLVWLPVAGLLLLLVAMVFRLFFRLLFFIVRRFRNCDCTKKED